jgi:hypothetical protein
MPHNEEGVHAVVIESQGLSVAKTGTEFFYVTFKPDGQHERSAKFYLTDRTIDRTLDDLEKLGIRGLDSFSQLDTSNANAVSIVGNEVELECRYETGQDGKSYERWGAPYTPRPMEPPVPAASKAIKQLDALFGAALRSRKGNAPASPAARTPVRRNADNTIQGMTNRNVAPQSYDDIPF